MAKKTVRSEPARPAPFTPEQVAALVAGQANPAEVGRLLTAHRQPRLPASAARARAKAGVAPVPLSAADLRELAAGHVPDRVRAELEKGRTGARRARSTRKTLGARPTRRPG